MSRMCRRHACASTPCDCARVTATAPPGWCKRGQQEPQGRNASLWTLAQGLGTFLSPPGAFRVKGGREQVRVSPQWWSQTVPSSTSI